MTEREAAAADLRVVVVPVTPFQQNCSLVFHAITKVGAVVDPGGDTGLIREAILKSGLSVNKIVITHGHIDHAGGAAELRDALGVPVVGPHRADQPFLDSLAESGARYGLTSARPVTPDQWIVDGNMVEIAGLEFRAIEAPGHSPGSIVYFCKAARFALMGDVLFRGSIGRTDLPGGNHAELLESIRERILPLGDDVVFLPGHGEGSSIGNERSGNPFLLA
jgi:glyoxylase-like metal-dependent hydrolase (beta-lactamase superfamily II)